MIPQRTLLTHLALMALPSAYIGAKEMHLGDSYFDFSPEITLFWLGVLALASPMLHGLARWNRSLSDSSRATLSSLGAWTAAMAQGLAVSLAFALGVDTDGIQIGLLFAVPAALIIGLYYGIVWLIRRFRKGRAPTSEQALEQQEPCTSPVLDQVLAVAGTLFVFCLGVFAPDFVDEFYEWRPDVVHIFEGNTFIPVVPLIVRSLMEISIPVGLVLIFQKGLLAQRSQKIAFFTSIALMATMGTFGSHLSQGTPLIWMSAENAEALIADELKSELHVMADRDPSRLCEYARTGTPEAYSGTGENYHFTYRGVPFGVFLSKYTPAVRELAQQLNCPA